MFEGYPAYPRYRTLRLSNPLVRGEDVYALQTALVALGGADPGVVDGILGAKTSAAIKAAQEQLGIVVDSLAGGGTQTALAHRLADRARGKYSLPLGLVRGQLSTESGGWLGNYSPRRDDGTFDAGVAQRNTKLTPAREGFDVPGSIEALGARLRSYYDKYAGVSTMRRRWELAAGAWNAPAYASWIARQEGASGVLAVDTRKPSDAARALLEQYMDSATAYMTVVN